MNLILAAAVTSSIALTGCGSSSNSNNGPGGGGGNPGFEKGLAVACVNPISVEGQGASDSVKAAKGKYQLSSMQMYTVSSSGDSVAATADARNAFRVSVDCNGVAAGSNLSGNLGTPEVIDLDTLQPSTQRKLSVSIKEGRVEEAITQIVQSQGGGQFSFDQIPKGRTQNGDGFVTIDLKTISADTIEMKIKFEFGNDSLNIAEYGRFTFVRQ